MCASCTLRDNCRSLTRHYVPLCAEASDCEGYSLQQYSLNADDLANTHATQAQDGHRGQAVAGLFGAGAAVAARQEHEAE